MKHEIIPIMAAVDCRVGTAHQTRFCHCERSEAISLHNSLFLVRHSIFTTTFFFLLLLFLIAAPSYAKYGGGTGEPNDPYLIYTADQMNAIGADANDWDKHFILMADIDLASFTGTEFNIIGYYIIWVEDKPFTGVFDGSGHTISNFSYTSTDREIGLFGYVGGENAVIKDLGLIDPDVDAGTGDNVGSLVGYNYGTITNCYVEGGSVSGANDVGGLVGVNVGTITNCFATGSVSGDEEVGGLVGVNVGTISNSYAAGSIAGDDLVGGLVGMSFFSRISNCYAMGNVSADAEVGGLVGHNWEGTILNCYAIGAVDGNDFTGGLVGRAYGFGGLGSYTSCFWDSDVNPDVTGIGNITDPNVVGKSTADMQTETTFTDAGWDFVGDDRPSDDWGMPDGGGYPILWWQLQVLPPLPEFSGGAGTAAEPYIIANADDLNDIGHNPRLMNKHFRLAQDIDLSEKSFYIIGSFGYPFTGVFDGSGFSISNFSYENTNTDYVGLFGYVDDPNTEIKDLTLIDPNVDAGTGSYIGALVGLLWTGTVNNCHIQGGSVSGDDYIGGLVGNNRGTISNCDANTSIYGETYKTGGLVGDNAGTISNCYAAGSVDGNHYAGGLTGWNSETISNCHATGSVTGDYETGGLVGYNFGTVLNSYATGTIDGGFHATGGLVGRISHGMISNCYATGEVTGDNHNGGLVGYISDGAVSNCYAVGSVDGNDYTGGLVGGNSRATISNCYSAGSVSGDSDVGGLVGSGRADNVSTSFWDIETSGQNTSDGGTGLPTVEMQMASTFFVWTCSGGSVWTIDEGNDYPRLWWENMPGKPITNPYGGGTGEPNDPYLIYTAEQLNTIGLIECIWDKHFLLMADIDLSGFTGTSFNIIGTDYYHPFAGVFDGSGHTIANFTYDSNDTDYIGLFGYVSGENAVIKNLGLIDPDVDGGTGWEVGSLVGRNRGTITNCHSTGSVEGLYSVGGLVGWNVGTVTDCYATGSVAGRSIGGLVGGNSYGTITNCYSTGSGSGSNNVGGLVGYNWRATITNCYASSNVSGTTSVGGLVGHNSYRSTITNCYAAGSASGVNRVGGLVGYNYRGKISDCYSAGSITGDYEVGGLVGNNGRFGTISNCYSTASVMGITNVGGLVGWNTWCDDWGNCYEGEVWASFWDTETSGQTTSAGGTGKTTDEMQTMSTFTDAGWDFTTPVWTIDEGVDYPRLWWELVPVLHAEPEITLGTRNTIYWDPVPGANDYYAECAEDANFTSIIYNTGWITETSYKFTGLQLGKRYWYSVKARNSAGIESNWSNVESSLQVTLADAVETMLDPDTLKNKNMKNALLNKINAVQQMLDKGRYEEALNKLQNDILQKTNGCAETGWPDKNDWIITCEEQSVLYPLVIETIEYVRGLMNQ